MADQFKAKLPEDSSWDIHRVASSDAHHSARPSIQEIREHIALLASIKGRRWYSKKLLEFQRFPNRHVASRTLIQLSRDRIEETRGRIVRTKNILAFSRGLRRWVN